MRILPLIVTALTMLLWAGTVAAANPSASGSPSQTPSLQTPDVLKRQPQQFEQRQITPRIETKREFVIQQNDSVRIRVSGVGTYGGSAVSQDGQMLQLSQPGIIILVDHGTLSIHGVVPGERSTYDYYLLIYEQRQGAPQCRFEPQHGRPLVNVDHPQVQGDGRARVIHAGSGKQIRNVTVPQDERVVQKYYARLCVLGTHPDTREYIAVSSNVVQFAVLPR